MSKNTYWYRISANELIVYTEDIKTAEKIPVKPTMTYMEHKNMRVTGFQYHVENKSDDWRLVFDGLTIGNSNENKKYSVKLNRKGEVID
ncbi:hypothetical protein [Paenibacillus naphthalenovorans]|uniref:Uncharacterized protein n=1 Tax=Paenibacillus naphthalenovorans TaxID=162209 RepID=A0A0U2W443_9BACL|nr:hypothetical protein [Paenibacillus naphthalenovorans]ALS22189.1 hypothetical protein IJ22_18150 [Paenibacillus naphthalenovorans]